MTANMLADLFDLMAIVGVGLLLGIVGVVCVAWVRERRGVSRRQGAKS